MIAISTYTGEKEIIFPEMAALTIGLWIVDKRVWKVNWWQIILLMTLGAVGGICIVRYSPLPYVLNFSLAFMFAGTCLLISRATLIPLISACMLPVLLHTETWLYPIAVLSLSVIAVSGQKLMERFGIRQPIEAVFAEKTGMKDIARWSAMLFFVFFVSLLAVLLDCPYFIIPPLVVTFAEMVNSKAGFRNRPTQIFLFLTVAATLGSMSQLIGYYYLHLPEGVIALFIAGCLFCIFEWTGKYFAPAGALAFIPMLASRDSLMWLPLQASIGAALFITAAMVVFQQCYKWNRAQLIFCMTPTVLRKLIASKP